MECGGLVICYLKLESGCIKLPNMTEWEDKTGCKPIGPTS